MIWHTNLHYDCRSKIHSKLHLQQKHGMNQQLTEAEYLLLLMMMMNLNSLLNTANIIIIIIIRHAPCQCVPPLATNSLHSGLSKASSIASSKVRLCRDRSLFQVAIQEV